MSDPPPPPKGQRDYSGARLSRHALERFAERFHVPEPDAEPALRAALARTRRLGRNPENGAVAALGLHRGRMLVAILQDRSCLTVLTWPLFEPRMPEFGRVRLPRKKGRMLRRLGAPSEGEGASASASEGGAGDVIIVLMGVSGSGKSTVGRALADRLGWPLHDADDYHPDDNVEKMSRGDPLSDEDRLPWLRSLAELIDRAHRRGEAIILACSALKHSHQEYLSHDFAEVRYVCLCGPVELIARRLEEREGHFMDPSLLESQLAELEVPDDALRVDVGGSPETVADEIRARLGL